MPSCWPLTRGDLTLRDATVADVEEVGAWRGDPRVVSWMLDTAVSAESLRRDLLGRRERETDHSCVVERDGEVVALGYLELVDDGAHVQTPRGVEALVGYVVRPDAWGQGIATAVAGALVEVAFRRLGVRRVKAACLRDNRASARVLEAVGLRREEHAVQACWHAERGWVDEYGYAVLATDHRGEETGLPEVRTASARVAPRRPLPAEAQPDAGRWRTERLVLDRAHEDDLAELAAWRNTPEVGAWMLQERVGVDVLRQAFAGAAGSSLVARLDGRVVGTCSITVRDGAGQAGGPTRRCEAEIGYSLAPWLHGRGLGREIAAAGLDVCFGSLGVRRVTAGLYLDNVASARLLAGLGMRLEQHGVRDSWHPAQGWVDGGTYAVLADEWRV